LNHQGFLGNIVAEFVEREGGVARGKKPFVLGSQKFLNVEPVPDYTGSYFSLAFLTPAQ